MEVYFRLGGTRNGVPKISSNGMYTALRATTNLCQLPNIFAQKVPIYSIASIPISLRTHLSLVSINSFRSIATSRIKLTSEPLSSMRCIGSRESKRCTLMCGISYSRWNLTRKLPQVAQVSVDDFHDIAICYVVD